MSVLIIVVTDGGADEFDTAQQWQDHHGKRYVSDKMVADLQDMIDSMEDKSFIRFGGGWAFKGVKDCGHKDLE